MDQRCFVDADEYRADRQREDITEKEHRVHRCRIRQLRQRAEIM